MEVECCKDEIVLADRSAWVYVHVLSCMHTRTPVFLTSWRKNSISILSHFVSVRLQDQCTWEYRTAVLVIEVMWFYIFCLCIAHTVDILNAVILVSIVWLFSFCWLIVTNDFWLKTLTWWILMFEISGDLNRRGIPTAAKVWLLEAKTRAATHQFFFLSPLGIPFLFHVAILW